MQHQTVVIVSTSDDAHANHIAPLIERRGAHVVRIDGDVFPTLPCHLSFCNERSLIEDLYRIDLLAVNVVWYRKVVLPERFDVTSQFIRQETEGLVGGLLMELDEKRWVNHRFAIERARSKLHQLTIARAHDFRVPNSIVTNEPEVLRKFAEQHQYQIVTKPIQTQVIVTPGSPLVLGTRKLGIPDLDSATRHFPCYAQERLIFRHEIRVVVFGSNIHAFALERLAPADDLKQLPLRHIRHRVCEIDFELSLKIRKFMRHYSLEFGALDFGVVDDGEPYFLELNPNGQWLWLQFATGYNLEDSFIDLLLT